MCYKCPNTAWLLFLAFFVVMFFMCGLAYWLNQKRVNLAGLSIGIDFLVRCVCAGVRVCVCVCVCMCVCVYIHIPAARMGLLVARLLWRSKS